MYPQVYAAHTLEESALAVAVALVSLGASVLDLSVHDLADERLGQRPKSSLTLTMPSSNLGSSGMSAPIAVKVSIAVIVFLESVYFTINDSSDGRFSCLDYSACETPAAPTFGT